MGIKKMIKRGAKWLDKNEGPTWVFRINLDRLDLNSGTNCILGQLHDEGYHGYLYDEGKDYGWAVRHGFDWETVENVETVNPDDLTDAWRAWITERRSQFPRLGRYTRVDFTDGAVFGNVVTVRDIDDFDIWVREAHVNHSGEYTHLINNNGADWIYPL